MVTRRSLRVAPPTGAGLETAAAAALSLALLASVTLASARLDGPVAFLPGVALLVCLFLAFNPRVEVSLAILALYLGLLDGYIKLSTGNPFASGIRDLLLYSIVAGALLRLAINAWPARLPKYTAHVLLLVAVVSAQAFNPGTPSFASAVGGIRQHIEFVPLFFLGYATMRTERRLKAFLVLLLVIVVANSIVALVQYGMAPDALAAWGPGYARAVLGEGAFEGAGRVFFDASGETHVRPFGLGSDFGVSGLLGWLGISGALALMVSRSGVGPALVGAVGVLACVTGIIASQARSAIFAVAFTLMAFVALLVTSRQTARALVMLCVGGLLIFAAITTFLDHQRGSPSRLLTLQDSSLVQTIREDRGDSASLILRYAVDHPLGVGLGRAGPAAVLGATDPKATDVRVLDAENEPNLLIGELGTVGLIVFASLWLRVLFDGVRAARRTTDAAVRRYLAALVAPLAAMTLVWFIATPTTTSPSAPYFWFVAGIVAWASTERAFAPTRQSNGARSTTRPS